MLRRFLLYLSHASWARSIVTHWGVARRVARRFVAGETLDEALQAARLLNQRGLLVSLDFLGESVTSAEDARAVMRAYRHMIERIAAEKVQASVSLKLTHLGLDISEEECLTNLRHILTAAKERAIGVTIDMESSRYTETTLRIYRTMRDEYAFDNAGTVIQAYLLRTENDMRALAAEGAHIRLCKGAYLEPPTVAFPEKAAVNANFVKVMTQFLRAPLTNGDRPYLCIATHDEAMLQAAEQLVRAENIPETRYEFQMLYGIRSARQDELAKQHKMRVYVPFGTAWYPYFMRRLAERPANLWFFARSFFAR
ncbi:MAG: proline dehydrogenase family protein [Chloroflexi bacterium]|nr:proline dehydrogenase family protein [Chloroflexota bacterium]